MDGSLAENETMAYSETEVVFLAGYLKARTAWLGQRGGSFQDLFEDVKKKGDRQAINWAERSPYAYETACQKYCHREGSNAGDDTDFDRHLGSMWRSLLRSRREGQSVASEARMLLSEVVAEQEADEARERVELEIGAALAAIRLTIN
jgi:hypothetical protein